MGNDAEEPRTSPARACHRGLDARPQWHLPAVPAQNPKVHNGYEQIGVGQTKETDDDGCRESHD